MRTLKGVKNYEKLVVRTIKWEMTPEQIARFSQNLATMDEELEKIDYKKGRPKITRYKDYIVYEYKKKPKIYFDPHGQRIKVDSKDYAKNEVACHNQASFLLETLRTLGYMNVKFGKLRMRKDLKTPEEKARARKLLEKRYEPEKKPIEWIEAK